MRRKWLQVKADKSVLLLEMKASLHRVSGLLSGSEPPGRLVICFPPHTSRVKSLLLKPSQKKALTLNRNKITA